MDAVPHAGRGVQVEGGKGVLLERVSVVEPIFASFRWARDRRVSGRRVDRQRMILAGQDGQCGCYLGEARADVSGHGFSSAAVVFVTGVGLGCGEPEVAPFRPTSGSCAFSPHSPCAEDPCSDSAWPIRARTFALMVTRRVAISALECDARHVVRSWHDLRDAGRSRGGQRGRRG